MRHGSNSRRSRGRNSGNNNNRKFNPKMHTYDSNGPEVRIRGNAHQITEKYTTLARDAASAGDNTLAESYYQHAEHYQRIINEFSSNNDKSTSASSNDKNDNKEDKESRKTSTDKSENTDKSESEKPAEATEKDKKPARKRTPRAKKASVDV